MSQVVRVTRTVDAPRDDVFDAWTDPDQLPLWLCPAPGVVGEASFDPTVGGQYRIVMVFDHGAYEVTGRYLVVDRPEKLVFTWRSDGVGGRDTLVTVTLDPVGDPPEQTEMTIVHERIPTTRAGHLLDTGWSNVGVALERLLTTRNRRR
jgi:uncharacterized protein YndB with AHSA1/START domain